MGSFLENIIKNAGLGSILGGAAGQSEGSEGGSLQDILNEIGVGDGNFDTSAVTGEDEQEEVAAEETAAPGGINLQDILGKLGGAVAGGGLGSLATGAINIINIAKSVFGNRAGVMDEQAAAGDEFEEVK